LEAAAVGAGLTFEVEAVQARVSMGIAVTEGRVGHSIDGLGYCPEIRGWVHRAENEILFLVKTGVKSVGACPVFGYDGFDEIGNIPDILDG
jgi:hypothetical protein